VIAFGIFLRQHFIARSKEDFRANVLREPLPASRQRAVAWAKSGNEDRRRLKIGRSAARQMSRLETIQ
jgi:hypothetical protein